jgi:hypothetical protein
LLCYATWLALVALDFFWYHENYSVFELLIEGVWFYKGIFE